MFVSLENRIISSFLLMIDHAIQKAGGYQNYSSLFYPIPSNQSGLYAYSAPFKQLCNDVSISGATVMSGIYLNNNFVTIGQSGLTAINHYQGAVYFNNPLPANTIISGNYSIKEFNIELSNKTEWKLLFETKYVSRNEFSQTLSGLPLDTKTSPIIYIIPKVQENRPFGFKHIDNSYLNLRCVIIADNAYQEMAATSALKNLYTRYVPVYLSTPFDSQGNMTGINYDYNQLSIDSGFNPWIQTARGVDIPQKGDFANIVKNMFMVDFEISTVIQT